MAVVERIYIGGLDPPRLIASEVLRRLENLDGVEVQPVINSQQKNAWGVPRTIDDNPFVHLTATVNEGSSSTALEVIAKTYHNVKWKGCRLVVEAAQPHFLERLKEERRQRQLKQEEPHQQSKEEVPLQAQDLQESDCNTNSKTPSRIPRRPRVRKKFGDEAFHVDTKPWSVDSWSSFSKAVGKLEKRKEKHAQLVKTSTTKFHRKYEVTPPRPLMHRAVHIRWDGSGNNDPMESDTQSRRKISDATEESSDSSDTSSQSSSTSAASAVAEVIEQASKIQVDSYAWSNEDGSDGNAGFKEESKDEMRISASQEEFLDETKDLDANDRIEDCVQSSSGPENENISTYDETDYPESLQEAKAVRIKVTQGYEWSSDESSNGEDDVKPTNTWDSSFRTIRQNDEFAAGFDLKDVDSNDGVDDDTEHNDLGDTPGLASSATLLNDVSDNLNILSSLFPEMADSKPAIRVDNKEDNNPLSASDTHRAQPSRQYFSAGAFMPRYDPRNATAQRYLEEDDSKSSKSELDDGSEGSSKNCGEGEEKKADLAKKAEAPSGAPTQIYEQGKLEDVFREARDAWHGKAEQAAGDTTNKNKSSGDFSFGFDLGEAGGSTPQQTDKNGGGFSFGFAIPDQGPSEGNRLERREEVGGECISDLADATDSCTGETPASENRRRGIFVPDDVLESYKADLLFCNEGEFILEDLDGFRNDESVKSHWNKERQTLTLDWKRKRKHAQSRIQKRMKIR